MSTHTHTLCLFQTELICACLQKKEMLVASAQERSCLSGHGCCPVTYPTAPHPKPASASLNNSSSSNMSSRSSAA